MDADESAGAASYESPHFNNSIPRRAYADLVRQKERLTTSRKDAMKRLPRPKSRYDEEHWLKPRMRVRQDIFSA